MRIRVRSTALPKKSGTFLRGPGIEGLPQRNIGEAALVFAKAILGSSLVRDERPDNKRDTHGSSGMRRTDASVTASVTV